MLRIFLVFGLCMGLFYLSTVTSLFRDFFALYLQANAAVSAWVLQVFGEDAASKGFAVSSARFYLEVRRGCDAIEPAALFSSAVVASPVALRFKAPGMIIGVAVLITLNLARIVSLFYTGIYFPELFETIHIDVWQPAFIFLTLLLWFVWAIWARRRAGE